MSPNTSGLTTAKRVRDWIERIGAKTLFIEPGSFWENGYNESFNGKLGDELLNVERSGGPYRGVEGDVQPDPDAQFVGLLGVKRVPLVSVYSGCSTSANSRYCSLRSDYRFLSNRLVTVAFHAPDPWVRQ